MPKIISIIMAIVIIYAVIDAKNSIEPKTMPTPKQLEGDKIEGNKKEKSDGDQKSEDDLSGGFVEKTLSQVMINVLKTPEGKDFVSKIITPANKQFESTEYSFKINDHTVVKSLFHIETTAIGEGPRVPCGYTVKANYKITNTDNIVVERGEKTFRLGDPEIIPALSNVIVGMQKGEQRKAMIHKIYSYKSPYFQGREPEKATDYYFLEVTLLDIAPSYFPSKETRIFDDEIAFLVPCLCGYPAEFHARIMRTDGAIIYDSKKHGKKINMLLGDDSYPMIFSYALFNKVPVGSRTVICDTAALKSFNIESVNRIFPKEAVSNIKDFVIVEFSDFPSMKNAN